MGQYPRLAVLFFVAALYLISGALSAQAAKLPPAPSRADIAALGLQEMSIDVGGVARWFLVQPPVNPDEAVPVLIVLHGGSQSMRRIFAANAGATRGWPALARRENVLLLVPNAMNGKAGDAASDEQNWNDLRENIRNGSDADDVGFIVAMVDWAARTYKTDRRRVYVTGASNGGIMTFKLLMQAPERFAAAAAFVASLPVEGEDLRAPSRPTPLMIANGTRDPLVQWEGGRIAGGRGTTRPVAATVQWWVKANGAEAEAIAAVELPDRDPDDSCIIQKRTFKASASGADVVAVTLDGGGHSLPSQRYKLPNTWFIRTYIGPVCRDVEGVDLIWDFLSRYSKAK
jgi:polyhydroxybutyrate depolymerase